MRLVPHPSSDWPIQADRKTKKEHHRLATSLSQIFGTLTPWNEGHWCRAIASTPEMHATNEVFGYFWVLSFPLNSCILFRHNMRRHRWLMFLFWDEAYSSMVGIFTDKSDGQSVTQFHSETSSQQQQTGWPSFRALGQWLFMITIQWQLSLRQKIELKTQIQRKKKI
jgi:hypothetical protein